MCSEHFHQQTVFLYRHLCVYMTMNTYSCPDSFSISPPALQTKTKIYWYSKYYTSNKPSQITNDGEGRKEKLVVIAEMNTCPLAGQRHLPGKDPAHVQQDLRAPLKPGFSLSNADPIQEEGNPLRANIRNIWICNNQVSIKQNNVMTALHANDPGSLNNRQSTGWCKYLPGDRWKTEPQHYPWSCCRKISSTITLMDTSIQPVIKTTTQEW